MIEPAFDRLYLGRGDRGKVGLLRKEAPHQPDRVLDGATLPAVEGLTEVGAGTEHVVRAHMLRVLGPIVVGQRQPHPRRIVAESAREGHAHLMRALPREAGEPRVARRPLNGDLERDGTGAGEHGIRLPVAELAACRHRRGPVPNRDPRRDMRGVVLARIAAGLTPTVRPDQTRYEIPGLGIDPLVDGLMADGRVGASAGTPTRNEFRRPARAEPVGHVLPQAWALEAPTLMRHVVAYLGPLLGLVRQVVARVDRRGIAPELSRQRAGRSSQHRGDLPQRTTVASEHRQDIAFMTREVGVGCRHSPRILARKPSTPPGVALAY